MFRFLMLVVCVVFMSHLHAQKKDTLDYIVKPLGLFGYKVNQKVVSRYEFYNTYAKDKTTLESFKEGKRNTTLGTIITYTGGLFLGWQLGDMLLKKSDGYQKAFIGAGLLGVGVPLAWFGQSKSTKALATFNDSDQILGTIDYKGNENKALKKDFSYRVAHACYIVRVPVSAVKINYYQDKLNSKGLAKEVKLRYKNELDKTLEENRSYVSLLQNSFAYHFSQDDVYFLPDSSFKSFIAGRQTGFINQTGTMDKSITCPHDENFFVVAGRHKEQLIFLDQNLQRLEAPFPYKKSIFLPSFRMILNRERYIDDQVSYFDTKLNFTANFD